MKKYHFLSMFVFILSLPSLAFTNQELLNAAARGDKAEVARLLKNSNVNINTIGKFSRLRNGTALMAAADGGHVEVVKLLLKKRADVNLTDTTSPFNPSALSLASISEHDEIMRFLINAGADVRNPNKINGTELNLAAKAGRPKSVRALMMHVSPEERQYAIEIANKEKEIRDYSDSFKRTLGEVVDALQGADAPLNIDSKCSISQRELHDASAHPAFSEALISSASIDVPVQKLPRVDEAKQADFCIQESKSQNMYIGKKEDGLYFVMERVNENNISFWKNYLAREKSLAETASLIVDGKQGHALKLKNEKLHNTIGNILYSSNEGIEGFSQYVEEFDPSSNSELWISYATDKPTVDPRKRKFADIEMSFTVSTSETAPFVTHMGINRGISSIQKVIEGKKFMHSGISVDLHSFAAKVMKKRDSNKQYMINVPLVEMRNILFKALPKGAVGIGDNTYAERLRKEFLNPEENPLIKYAKKNEKPEKYEKTLEKFKGETSASLKEYEENKSLINITKGSGWLSTPEFSLTDDSGKIILDKVDLRSPGEYEWFFGKKVQQPNRKLPYVTVNLDALAQKGILLDMPESALPTGF